MSNYKLNSNALKMFIVTDLNMSVIHTHPVGWDEPSSSTRNFKKEVLTHSDSDRHLKKKTIQIRNPLSWKQLTEDFRKKGKSLICFNRKNNWIVLQNVFRRSGGETRELVCRWNHKVRCFFVFFSFLLKQKSKSIFHATFEIRQLF